MENSETSKNNKSPNKITESNEYLKANYYQLYQKK